MSDLPMLENATVNVDVAMIVRLLDRSIVEVVRSQSSGISGVREADAARVGTYLDELDSFTDWSSRQPESDTPKSHPIVINLAVPLAVPPIENDSMWRLAQLLDTARYEVANSASARLPNGASKPDLVRWKSYYSDARRFMLEHVAKVTPVDLPESSPRNAMQGQGATGI